jgi:release factor glutamine methyltransferase
MTGMNIGKQVALDVVQASLASPLSKRCKGKIDILIFNPPYVPTDEAEKSDRQRMGDIGSAWAGGAIGMDVTNKLLEQVQVRPSYGKPAKSNWFT